MSKNDSSNTKKKLFLDIGNSSIKAAYKQDDSWHRASEKFKSVNYLISWLNKYSESVEALIIASVRKDHFNLLESQLSDMEIIQVKIDDIDEAKLDYSTPQTLGIDRYLGCLGAYQNATKAVVVIDAGSACTIDMMDKTGVYLGGIIMPGLQSLLNIFKINALELPEIEIGIPSNWPGKSTEESLQWGQLGFFMDGIESALNRYQNQFGDFDLYITGGDSDTISSLLNMNSKKDEFLIFKGLEAITGE